MKCVLPPKEELREKEGPMPLTLLFAPLAFPPSSAHTSLPRESKEQTNHESRASSVSFICHSHLIQTLVPSSSTTIIFHIAPYTSPAPTTYVGSWRMMRESNVSPRTYDSESAVQREQSFSPWSTCRQGTGREHLYSGMGGVP
jgi:hypothetical protein